MNASKPVLFLLLLSTTVLPFCAGSGSDSAAPAGARAATFPSPGADSVVARIGNESITLADVDLKAAQTLSKLRQQEYETRRKTIEQMLAERLYAQEAQSRDISVEELIKAEVDDKITAPTEAEIADFYESNKSRMGGKPLEEIGPRIGDFLGKQSKNERLRVFFKDMMAKANASILLDPPRANIPMRAGEPSLGPDDALVTIVEFADFQCPFCRAAHATVKEVLDAYGDQVRFVYRDYPLQNHPRAIPASKAARCAGDQGKYWDYHRDLMTVEGSLGDDDLEQRAKKLGLDMKNFKTCYQSDKHAEVIQTGFDDGVSIGVTGTPSFFVNGRLISGARSLEDFKNVIDEELERSARENAGS